MAREPSVLNEDEVADSSEETDDTGGNDGLLHRRSYLKLAGTATATAAIGAATSTAAANESTDLDIRGNVDVEQRDGYTYIEVHDECNITVREGEVIENLLIENHDRRVYFECRSLSEFEIRNVGVTGRQPGTSSGIFHVGCSGTGLIENVYLGEGGQGNWTDKHRGSNNGQASSKAIFTHHDHTGELVVRDMYVGPFADNTFYCENQGSNGDLHFENVYAYGGCISIFRPGGGGSHTMRNCHVENAGVHPDNNHDGSRDVWLRSGQSGPQLDIYDSQLSGAGAGIIADGGPIRLHGDTDHGGSRGNVIVVDETVGNNPNPQVPETVPTSAEAAALGDQDSSDTGGALEEPEEEPEEEEPEEEHDLPNVVVFDGDGAAETTRYEFVASGEVEPSTDEDATIDDAARVDDTHASGVVADWRDAFRFDGEIERLTIDGPANVRINGEEVNPDDFDDVLQNVILFDGSDEAVTRYEFEVDGDVQKSNYRGASIDDEDVIEDDYVHGVVADWKDAFRFSGDLEQLTVDGPATVHLNGEDITPSDYGEELPHVIRVEGRGVPTSYEITVDGSIELASADDPESEATAISGGTVQSSLAEDEVQEFDYSGAITDVTFSDGKAAIFVDGEEIDTSAYGDHKLLPHALVIDGTEADGASAYSFKLGGKVIKSDHLGASIDDEDVIDGRSVRGVVAGWLDAYWFDGDVEELTVLGDATANVQYNARNQ